MLKIFRAELLGQLVVKLRRRQIRRLDLSDQRERDVAGKVDVIITREIIQKSLSASARSRRWTSESVTG